MSENGGKSRFPPKTRMQLTRFRVILLLVLSVTSSSLIVWHFSSASSSPSISRVVTPGAVGPCTWFISLDGTTPVAEAMVGGLSVNPGDNMVGTAGQDFAGFLNSIASSNSYFCLSGQTFTVSTTLIIGSNERLVGSNSNRTLIQLANNANIDVIQTANFNSLTGTNAGYPANSNVPHDFQIENLKVDCNKSNNAAGRGIVIYGSRYILTNVEVRNCPSDGIYSEYGTSGTVSSPDQAFESIWTTVRSDFNGGVGIRFRGPADSIWSHVFAYVNSGDGIRFESSATYTAGAMLLNGVHAYGQTTSGKWGMIIQAGSIQGINIESESNANGILVSANEATLGSLIFGNTAVGLQLGQGGQTGTAVANTRITGVIAAPVAGTAIAFTNETATYMRASGFVSGTVSSGTPGGNDNIVYLNTNGGGQIIVTPATPASPITVTAGASVWTYTDNDGYSEFMFLTVVAGISAWTCNGGVTGITLGTICPLNIGQSMSVTWATTAPQFRKIPWASG